MDSSIPHQPELILYIKSQYRLQFFLNRSIDYKLLFEFQQKELSSKNEKHYSQAIALTSHQLVLRGWNLSKG
jgi:hypothetical protein